MQTLTRSIPDEAATLAAGEAIGRLLAVQDPSVLRLHVNLVGDLGAGKTTLVRGVLRGLGYAGRVKSPTYPLLETYQIGGCHCAHFDLYRLETPEAFVESGFDEYFAGPGVRFVEWPARGGRHVPVADWTLSLLDAADGGRTLSIETQTSQGDAVLAQLLI